MSKSKFPMNPFKPKKIHVTGKSSLGVVDANEKYFLKGTTLPKQYAAFIFINGGLGDYINFMSAAIWAAKENPHLIGRIYVREPFRSVAKYIMREFPEWKVLPHEELPDLEDRALVHYPKDQLINATGAHLMDLGFKYYALIDRPPEGYGYLPEINYTGQWKWPELKVQPYAVFTPGATAKARVMKGRYFNELVAYTRSRGVTPVFLGKRDFVEGTEKNIGYNAVVQDDYDLSKGIDLTEKTSILEAVQIMSKAVFVLGLDNGLLHFAGTTTTPIIFGHNVATVEHREIRRRQGLTINIKVNESDLACIGCQSRMRYIVGHKFNECLYKEKPEVAYKCLDLLFAERCQTWKAAIDHILDLPKTASLMNSYATRETDSPSP